MSQEIKIPVSAQVDDRGVKKLDDAFSEVAQTVSEVGDQAAEAAAKIRDLEAATRSLAQTREILRRELGRDVSEHDARTFERNFRERIRARSPKMRTFETVEDWYQGHGTVYGRQSAAHRRFVLGAGMQGTDYAREHGAPAPLEPEEPPEPGGGGGGGGRGGGGGGNRAASVAGRFAQRASRAFMGFGGAMLGFAGVQGLAAMGGKAIGNYTDEAIGTDTLKRRLGDLGVDFDRLRDKVRGASDGMGVTWTEASQLAQSFAKVSGRLNADDVGQIGGSLHAAFGVARAYGVDPGEATAFFGTQRRVGNAVDDQGARRLAMMIGDSVARSGWNGKVDEILGAISAWTTQAARQNLTTPNVDAYMNAMTSLMSGKGTIDPAAAAGILGQADTALRQGGAAGAASQMFNYNALLRATPGLSPIGGMALWQSGIFGTVANTFGDEKTQTPLGAYSRANGLAIPGGDPNQTNIDKILPLMKRTYGAQWLPDAIANNFGLNLQQSAALATMSDKGQLGATGKLLGSLGKSLGNVSANGLVDVAAVANAGSRKDLNDVVGDILKRRDLTTGERDGINKAMGSPDLETARRQVALLVATKEQEKTEGQETRDSIKGVEDAMTMAGKPLVDGVNRIRDLIGIVAKHLAPQDFMKDAQQRDLKTTHFLDKVRSEEGTGGVNKVLRQTDAAMARYDALKKAGKNPTLDDVAPLPNAGDRNTWVYDELMAVRQSAMDRGVPDGPGVGGGGGGGGQQPTGAAGDKEQQAMAFFMGKGLSKAQAAAMVGNLEHESGLREGVRGDGGRAFGIAQWHPDRWKAESAWAQSQGYDPSKYAGQLQMVYHELMNTRHGRNLRVAKDVRTATRVGVSYEGPSGYDAAHGYQPEYASGWGNRLAIANRLNGTPTPVVQVAGAVDVTVRLPDGTVVGRGKAKVAAPGPAAAAGTKAAG